MSNQFLYLASGNTHKSLELSELLAHENTGWCVATPSAQMPEVDECGDTFLENATIKAKALCQIVPSEWVLADDSGLEVDALDGAPGVYSARYAGVGARSEQLIEKLLHDLKDVPEDKRKAHFTCVLLVITADGKSLHFEGRCEGQIALEPSGHEGFGYDPVFIPQGHSKSFGELGSAIKEKTSHRARAVKQLAAWLLSEA